MRVRGLPAFRERLNFKIKRGQIVYDLKKNLD